MKNCQKLDFFEFCLYSNFKLSHYRSIKKPIKYMFCFICSEQCITIILSCKKCGLICSVFKNTFPHKKFFSRSGLGNSTPHTLSMAYELLMVSRLPSQNCLITTLKVFFTFFECLNELACHLIAKLILFMGRF